MSQGPVLMRVSPRALELSGQMQKHRASCPACSKVASPDFVDVLRHPSLACLDGVLLAQEFAAEYQRLHSRQERAEIDRLAKEVYR